SRVMGDALARLEREGEGVGHLRCPLQQHVLLRQSVELVVDLYRRNPAGVETEEAVILQISGVEVALPLLERVAAGSRQDLHETMRFDSAFSFLLGFSLARLPFSASIKSSILVSVPGATSDVMSWPSILRWMVSSIRSRTVS